jgi:hypothetical protein
MVSIDRESRKPKGGVTIPTKCFVPLALLAAWMAVMQAQSLMRKYYESNGGVVQAYQETKPIFRNPDQLRDQCKVYMAESSVAKGAGLGIFTGVGVLKDEMVGFPDLCIFIGDAPSERTHIRSHTFGWASFFGVRLVLSMDCPRISDRDLGVVPHLFHSSHASPSAAIRRWQLARRL